MNWDNAILITSGSCGIAFLVAVVVGRVWPAKEINDLYGYRTSRSKANQEAWDFSQSFASKRMLEVALALLFFGGLGLFLPVPAWAGISISILFIIGGTVYIYVKTEKALKEKFGE